MLYIHLFLKFATPLTCYILVVNILAALGVFWNVSNTIMGILILAPANSIGDYVADTALAKERGQVLNFEVCVLSHNLGESLNLLTLI